MDLKIERTLDPRQKDRLGGKSSGPERHPFDSAEPITTPLVLKHPESGFFVDWFLGDIECFNALIGLQPQ